MSECALPSVDDINSFSGLGQEGIAEFEPVAVTGGRAELPVIAGIAPVAEKPEADGNPELNTTASPAVCEGLGRAACAGCPFFRNCFGQQPEAVDKTAPPNYLEELLDEKGPAMVMARPAASKEQPSPPEASAQKQPDTPPSVAPVEELSRLLTPVEEPAVSPEAITPVVEPEVKNESTQPVIETPPLQPSPTLAEARSASIEERASASSEECSTLQPTAPEVDTAATPTKESDGAELLAASQPMGAASVVVSPRREPTIREAAVEVNIRPIDQSPVSPVAALAEPTLRGESQAAGSTVSARVFGDEPQSVPLVETEAATAPSITTLPDLLQQPPVGDGAVELLVDWIGEEAAQMKYTFPDAPFAVYPEELLGVVDDEGCEKLPCQTERNGSDMKRSDVVMPGSETRQSVAASDEGSGLSKQPGVDIVVDEPVDSLSRPQGQAVDTACEQSPVANKIAVVEEGGVEQSDNPLEDCQTEAGVVMALQPPDIVVKTTSQCELVDNTAVPFENGVSPYDESLADNSPETESPAPRNDTPWWSTILGMVAVFVALQRRQGVVY